MEQLLHPAATDHLPPFITAPGQTDVLFNVMLVFVLLMIFLVGILYLRLHALPEHMAHGASKVQLQIVGALGLIALFTHNHLFWIAALLLAMVEFPDFSSPVRSMARSLAKIAGRDESPADQTPAADAPTVKPPAAPKDPSSGTPPTPPKRPVTKPPADDGADKASDRTAGRTSTLLAVLGLVVVVLVAQCGWFVWNSVRDVKVATVATGSANEGEDGGIMVPDGRPVVLNQLAVQEGVDAAASAAQIMFARNWKTYDDGVEDALSLMTESFADEYRTTTDDVKQEFIAKKTEVQVRVVAQSVVRANDAELEALVFLNQYVFRGEGDDAKSTYTPYRALLTMVHTDDGWLVDGIATK